MGQVRLMSQLNKFFPTVCDAYQGLNPYLYTNHFGGLIANSYNSFSYLKNLKILFLIRNQFGLKFLLDKNSKSRIHF